MGGVPLEWVLKLRRYKMEDKAKEVVEQVLTELSGRKGLDIEELINDDEIYQELVDSMVERVLTVLNK